MPFTIIRTFQTILYTCYRCVHLLLVSLWHLPQLLEASLDPLKASTYAWQAELMSDLDRPRPTLHSLGDPPQESPTKKLAANSWTSSLRKHVSIHVLDSSWWLFDSTPFEEYWICNPVKLDHLYNVRGELIIIKKYLNTTYMLMVQKSGVHQLM